MTVNNSHIDHIYLTLLPCNVLAGWSGLKEDFYMFRSFTRPCAFASLWLMSSTCVASTQINPGTVEDVVSQANRHPAISQSKQRRTSTGWMQVKRTDQGAATGFYQAGNWLKFHDRTLKVGVGSIGFSFNPAKLECTQGMTFKLEVGNSTTALIEPNCNDLLNGSVKYPISHTFDLIPDPIKPQVTIPLDPAGLFSVGVKFGVGVTVGADFVVGGVVGGEDSANSTAPRRPDYIYASAEPYVAGNISGATYGRLAFGLAEAGVKGKFTLLKVKGKGELQAGIRRQVQDEQVHEQGFVTLKVGTGVSGGDGKLEAYCQKLWGLLYFSAELLKWDPFYKFEKTLFEQTQVVWDELSQS